MKIHTFPQRSKKWHQFKIGLISASRADQIITPDGKKSRQWTKYKYRLAYERLVRQSAERDLSHFKAVREGIEREPDARREFSVLTGLPVEEIGIMTTDDERIGCSPDAVIVDRKELVEIKCPEGATLIGYLDDETLFLDSYRPQIQMQLWVSGWERAHFYAYHPNTPGFYRVVRPDKAYMAQLGAYLMEFVSDLDQTIERVKQYGPFFPMEALLAEDEEAEEAA